MFRHKFYVDSLCFWSNLNICMSFLGYCNKVRLMGLSEMQKGNFFYTGTVWAKIISPKNNKSNLRQNSLKGQKDPNSAKKAKKLHKVPKCAKKCHQKAHNRNITHFCNKAAFFVFFVCKIIDHKEKTSLLLFFTSLPPIIWSWVLS